MTFTFDMEFMGVLTNIDHRARSVWIAHLATSEKIKELGKIDWYDPSLGRYENKTRMKEVGSATMSFVAFIGESLFMGLSKSQEDLCIDLKVSSKIKYDIWKSPLQPEYLHEAKLVRSVGNVIKHNKSIVESRSSLHGKFLVEEVGIPESSHLDHIFLSSNELLKIDDINYFMYIYCLDLLRLTTGFQHQVLTLPASERRSRVAEYLVPPVLNLNAV
jgi:hypothetical protein